LYYNGHMRHITWDCDGCNLTLALDFTNSYILSTPLPDLPNMDWRKWGMWLFCPECCVHIDAAVGQIIRDRYKESK
jgi:hypothetical protein